MSNDEILRIYACAALTGLLAAKGTTLDVNFISKQAWLIACEMRLMEMEHDEG